MSLNAGLLFASLSQHFIINSFKYYGQPNYNKFKSGLPLSKVTNFIIAGGFVDNCLYGVSRVHISHNTI